MTRELLKEPFSELFLKANNHPSNLIGLFFLSYIFNEIFKERYTYIKYLKIFLAPGRARDDPSLVNVNDAQTNTMLTTSLNI